MTGILSLDKALNRKKFEISDDGSFIKSTFSFVKFLRLFSSKTYAKNFIFIFLQNFSKIFIFWKDI